MGIGYLVAISASSMRALTLSPALCTILLPHRRLPEKELWVVRSSRQLYHPLLKFPLRCSSIIISPDAIISIGAASLIAAMIIVPILGRVFLPEFQESTLVNTLTLYPGVSLEATNRAGSAIQYPLSKRTQDFLMSNYVMDVC